MKKLLFLIALLYALKVNAQDYLISFAGTGASASVNNVIAENLTKGTLLTLNGSDILHLSVLTGVNSIESVQSSEMKVYPNPVTRNSILHISPPLAGKAIISVHDITGKLVFQSTSYLENYTQEFNFSGLKSGFYIISVKGSNYKYSVKVLSNSEEDGTFRLEKISNNQSTDGEKAKTDTKGELITVDMNYNTGDRLKFTGVSGNYSTVVTAVPVMNKTITFNFIPCTDGDAQNYPIVQIGTQTWMAENLKTTHYSDGTSVIPLVIDNTAWSNLATPGYCWLNNDINYKNTYGALYNWYTINTNMLCPQGWIVPTLEKWTTLIDYLGGQDVAGGKLKETGYTHWNDPNIGATNETGFTALPGSNRSYTGSFSNFGIAGKWWSSTSGECEMMNNYQTNALVNSGENRTGASVRCIKNYKIVLRILDASSWTLENQTLSIVPDAVIKLYTTQSSFDNNLPDFTTTSDADGMVLLPDLPVQNQYIYFLIVEKNDLRSIKDGYIVHGVFNNQADIDSWPMQAGAYIGGLKYADVNADGIINSDDRAWHDLISVTGDQTVTKTVIIGK